MSKPKSNPIDHWQVGKSLTECIQYVLDNGPHDVIFKLQYKHDKQQKKPVYIKATRFVLLARSPVFEAMFDGNFEEKTDGSIEINDVEPGAFSEMIRYIYTDHANLTADNVMAVMYASKKYIIPNLTRDCSRFVEKNITAQTAPTLLDQSMLFDEKELEEKVLAKIEEEATQVLVSEEFITLSTEALHAILQMEMKVQKELEVFEACIKWAEKRCRDLKKAVNGPNLRQVLGDNLFQIRFPTMDAAELSDNVVPYDILTADEERKVFRHFAATSNKPTNLPFPTTPRGGNSQTATATALVSPQGTTHPTPRSLFIPGPYQTSYAFGGTLSTNLQCHVSRPICLSKIFVHYGRYDSCTVNVMQNGRNIHRDSGVTSVVDESGGIPEHGAVNVADVRVEAGPMQLDIQVNIFFSQPNSYYPRSATQLSDNDVTITFQPVSNNMLLGIEYTPAV